MNRTVANFFVLIFTIFQFRLIFLRFSIFSIQFNFYVGCVGNRTRDAQFLVKVDGILTEAVHRSMLDGGGGSTASVVTQSAVAVAWPLDAGFTLETYVKCCLHILLEGFTCKKVISTSICFVGLASGLITATPQNQGLKCL